MDKNSLLGIAVIMAIIIGWSVWMSPDQQENEAYQRRMDSLQMEQNRAQQENSQLTETPVQNTEVAAGNPGQNDQQNAQMTKGDSPGTQDEKRATGPFGQGHAEDSLFYIENEKIKVAVSSQGGRVYSVELKEYVTHDSAALLLFEGDENRFGFNFFAGNRLISTNDLYFTLHESVMKADTQYLKLRLLGEGEEYIEYAYKLAPDTYMMDFDINLNKINRYWGNNTTIEIDWELTLPQLERGSKNENMYTAIYYKHFQDEVDDLSSRSNKDEEDVVPTKLKWIAFKHQFFSSVLIARDVFESATLRSTDLEEQQAGYLKKCYAQMALPVTSEEFETIPLQFYFGPNHFQTLQGYGMELQELVSLGSWIIKWINQYVIIPVFNWLDNYFANYGLIILLLTLIIKSALFPLTYRSYLSTAKMRALKPKVDEVKSKFSKEKQMEAQQATMALYKKVGVSPLGGCLPMLLQMPILIAMYRFFPTSIELRQEAFLWASDLSTYDSVLNLPFSIPFYGDHVSLFTLLMTVTTILSMKMNSQPGAYDQPGMKTMMYIMPVMFLFIFNGFASGLTFYLVVANIITIGQNTIFNYYIDDEALLAKLEAAGKKRGTKKKSKFQERLEQVAKDQNAKKKR